MLTVGDRFPAFRLKAVVSNDAETACVDLDHDDPHTLVVVIEPLAFHPAELEGCALEWESETPETPPAE